MRLATCRDPGGRLCAGVIDEEAFYREEPRYLRDQDLVEVEIEGIGKLSNRVVAERVRQP